MTNKDIKAEARKKLALNMHQAIVLYTIEFAIYSTLVALIVMSCMCLSTVNKAAAIVMICYGVLLFLIAMIGSGMLGFSMTDFYIASYKCKPYNVHRLGDTLARGGVTKILLLNVKRVLLGFLLTLCLIVPGVFYLIRTSMANHLLIANPKLKASGALKASSSVMSGKTGAYFSLMASMIGWYLLGIVTLGLGFIFIMPYINLTKTVYYKRNLQGDKSDYKIAIQPVSPVISSPSVAVQARSLESISEPMPTVSTSEPARPIVIDSPDSAIPPMGTLRTEDIEEMNATMRDLGVPDLKTMDHDVPPPVQEIPISPVMPQQKKSASVSQPYSADGTTRMGEHPIEDTGLVEIVKPVTTREIDEANVMGRRIDSMFSQTKPREEQRKDYMSNPGHQAPDDFVTSEIDPIEPVQSRVSDVGASPDKPPMSDSEFDAFIRSFEIPEQDAVFKPLVRSTSTEKRASDAGAYGAQQRGAAYTPHVAPQRSGTTAERASVRHPGADAEESRTERVRREREERLNNLRK